MDRSTLLLLAHKLTDSKSEHPAGILAGPCTVTVSADGVSASWTVEGMSRGEDSARGVTCPAAAILDHLVASAGLVPGLRAILEGLMLDTARGMKAPACSADMYRKVLGAAGLPTIATVRGSVSVLGAAAVVPAPEDCDHMLAAK